MCTKLLNHKGISLVEVMIAVLLTGSVAVALLSMQTLSLKTAQKADVIGRAAGVLQAELELREAQIMRGYLTDVMPLGTAKTKTVHASDPISNTTNPPATGDLVFNVSTTVTQLQAPVPGEERTGQWLLKVQVTWPGNTKGIRSSIIATTQGGFYNPTP